MLKKNLSYKSLLFYVDKHYNI